MDDPQLPPHDLNAEAAVLSAVLIVGHGQSFDEVMAVLRPEHFYSEAHRHIFEACVDLHGRGKPLDVVMVGTRLRDGGRLEQVGGMAYLVETLNAAPVVHNVAAYAEIVRSKWRMRQVIFACQEIVARGYHDTTGDAQVFVDAAEAKLHELARAETTTRLEAFATVAARVHGELAARKRDGGIAGQPTGYADLDRLMHGLRPGTLTIVAARPGVGKTALALNIAMFTAQEVPGRQRAHVPFFTLEMSNDELATRALSATASIDQGHFYGNTMNDGDWSRLTGSIDAARMMHVHLCDDPDINVFAVRAHARRLRSKVEQRGERLGLVVVDYLQLMESPTRRKSDNREQEVAGISRALKKLAKELQVPVIALSQLNRGVEARGGESSRPKLSDLRESGAIEQDADNVILIHRLPKPKTATPGSVVVNLHEVIVAKARNGRRGTVRMHFDAAYTRFVPIQGERDEFHDEGAEAAQ